MSLTLRLDSAGVIHGDFNEFNIMIKEVEEANGDVKVVPVVIDFPQMVSIDHANADEYFQRDVDCIKLYFSRRFGFVSDDTGPHFAEVRRDVAKSTDKKRVDVKVEASGFSKKMAKDLDAYMKEHNILGDRHDVDGLGGAEDEDEDEDEDDDEETEEGADKDEQDATGDTAERVATDRGVENDLSQQEPT